MVGENIRLLCTLSKMGHPSEIQDYVWFVNDQQLQDDKKYTGTKTSYLNISVIISIFIVLQSKIMEREQIFDCCFNT